jgi:hypothetical protein
MWFQADYHIVTPLLFTTKMFINLTIKSCDEFIKIAEYNSTQHNNFLLSASYIMKLYQHTLEMLLTNQNRKIYSNHFLNYPLSC